MMNEGTKLAAHRQERHGEGAADLGRAEGLPGALAARHQVNVTLCFSANQALLAAKAGATFISPFVGRLDDISIDGMELIREIRTIYDNYDLQDRDPRRLDPHGRPCQAGGDGRRRRRDRSRRRC